jgi:hypothetical protein
LQAAESPEEAKRRVAAKAEKAALYEKRAPQEVQKLWAEDYGDGREPRLVLKSTTKVDPFGRPVEDHWKCDWPSAVGKWRRALKDTVPKLSEAEVGDLASNALRFVASFEEYIFTTYGVRLKLYLGITHVPGPDDRSGPVPTCCTHMLCSAS